MIRKSILIAVLLGLFHSCYVGRFFMYNFADIRDYKKFPRRELKQAAEPFYFKEAPPASLHQLMVPKSVTIKNKAYTFEKTLEVTHTVAFLAIRNDSILYEWYKPHYTASSIVPSFSMAKSYVSALIGIAIQEGAIRSTDEPITNYLEDLDKSTFGTITIQHLLDMRSGIRYIENYYNPFGDVAKYYYGTHLKKYARHLTVKEAPGKHFEYISLNTQLLGLILEKATGKHPTDYLQEKIWSQIGTEFDASWSIDSRAGGTEKAFCCINARARDFAKFGRLYLHKGKWQGKQIVPEAWVEAATVFKTPKNQFLYSNQWWHEREFFPASDSTKLKQPYIKASTVVEGKTVPYLIQPTGDYFAQGFLGQFIYVCPSKNMIFVKLAGKDTKLDWADLLWAIARKN